MQTNIRAIAYKFGEIGLKSCAYLAASAAAGLTLGLVGAFILHNYREYVQIEPLARLYLWLGAMIALPLLSLKLLRNFNHLTK